MSLLNFFRRKLLGEANVMQPSGFEPGVDTQGLLGQGGQFGGGLLQSNLSQMNQGEGGLLSNIPQAAILGSAIYGQGIQGKDPLAAFFPAAMQTASFKSAIQPKKTELQKNLEAAGYKAGTPEYQAALTGYLTKDKQNTLSQEALALYQESKAAPDFNTWFKKLPENEKQLWNKYIKGNEDIWSKLLTGGMPDTNNDQNILQVPDKKSELIDGQSYNVNGQILKWNKEKDQFE
jgi:hypothetical protein